MNRFTVPCLNCNTDKTFPLWDSVDRYLPKGLDFIQEGFRLFSFFFLLCIIEDEFECFKEEG